MRKFVDSWRNAWQLRAFRDQMVFSIIGLFISLTVLRVFLDYVEARGGVRLPDPLLPLYSPIDLTWVTFSLVYSGMLLGIVSLCLSPFSFLLALRSFVALIILRIGCLFLLPLEPPAETIPLVDPIIRSPLLRPHLTRDLFFSQEVALMALLALTARWKDVKIIFACLAVAVSILLLLQHAQYTIDVVAAGAFAYAAYGIAKHLTIEEMPGLTAKNRNGGPRHLCREVSEEAKSRQEH